jgi:hypothetical protein
MAASADGDVDSAQSTVDKISDSTKKAEAQAKVDEMKEELDKLNKAVETAKAQAAIAQTESEAAQSLGSDKDAEKADHVKKAIAAEDAARAAKETVIDCLVKIGNLKKDVSTLAAGGTVKDTDNTTNNEEKDYIYTPVPSLNSTTNNEEDESLDALKYLVDLVRHDGSNDSSTEVVDLGKFEKIYKDAAGNTTLQNKIKKEIEEATGYSFKEFQEVVDFAEDWAKTHTTWGKAFETALKDEFGDRPDTAYMDNFNSAQGGIVRKYGDLLA